jgi:hypothetical protein
MGYLVNQRVQVQVKVQGAGGAWVRLCGTIRTMAVRTHDLRNVSISLSNTEKLRHPSLPLGRKPASKRRLPRLIRGERSAVEGSAQHCQARTVGKDHGAARRGLDTEIRQIRNQPGQEQQNERHSRHPQHFPFDRHSSTEGALLSALRQAPIFRDAPRPEPLFPLCRYHLWTSGIPAGRMPHCPQARRGIQAGLAR